MAIARLGRIVILKVGVWYYVRNTLRATILAKSNTEMDGKPLQVEYLMCRVFRVLLRVFFFLIYRPPKISYTASPDFLLDLRDHCSSYSHKVIMGDLNTDLFNTSSETAFTKKLFNELSLKVVDHNATNRPPGFDKPKTWIDVTLMSTLMTPSFHRVTQCLLFTPAITLLMSQSNFLFQSLLWSPFLTESLTI